MDFEKLRKFQNAKYIFVIGIGGSNLASKAVWNALTLHKPSITKKVLFLESPDAREYEEVSFFARNEIKNVSDFAIVGISKSGETLETLEAFRETIQILKDFFDKDVYERTVVVSTPASTLWKEGESKNAICLEWQEGVGGRFSAFTIAHTSVLFLAGLDVTSYLEGESEMKWVCEKTENHKKLANLIFENYKENKIRILDFFFFNDELEDLGKWSRQLFAESLGKENSDGQRIELLPTVSIGPSDLHSMLQLSFGGERDRFTIFIKSEAEMLGTVNQKSFDDALSAYKREKLPVSDYILKEINEREIAKFMQFFMLVVVSLASLFGVDPYNQPEVEEYKKHLRNNL